MLCYDNTVLSNGGIFFQFPIALPLYPYGKAGVEINIEIYTTRYNYFNHSTESLKCFIQAVMIQNKEKLLAIQKLTENIIFCRFN